MSIQVRYVSAAFSYGGPPAPVVAPTPDFTGVPLSGTTPLVVTFTNTSIGTYTSLLWNFGDGQTSTSANPTHAYASAGSYTVTLTLTYGSGQQVVKTRTNYVTASVPLTYLLTFAAADTATVGVSASGSLQNTGTGSVSWSITPPTHVSVTPSSGTLAAGGTQALSFLIDTAGSYDVSVSSGGTTITGNSQTIVASAVEATLATLSGPTTGVTGSASTFSVTLNGVAPTGGVSVSITAAGASLSTSTLTWSAGQFDAKTFTVTRASDGTTSVSISVTGIGVSAAGSPISFTSSADLAWTFSAGGQLTLNANTDTTIATSVPAGSSAVVSPALPPGASLLVPGDGTIIVRCDATLPSLDTGSSDAVMATVAARDLFFDAWNGGPQLATIQNATKSITYPPQVGLWNTVVAAMSDGDTILISPGAVHQQASDLSNYESNNLDSCMLAISKQGTYKNMPGRGYWWPWTGDEYRLTDIHGICIFAPGDSGNMPGQGTIIVEGFRYDNWGRGTGSAGVNIRNKGYTVGSWSYAHTRVELRNFEIGKPPYEHSASGVVGVARTLILEDAYIYDTGDSYASAASGNDHNAYISAETMSVLGVWFRRTRGMSADGTLTMDGHMLKAAAVNATIEGCAFDADPDWGDNSFALQAFAGGNFVVRGCTFRDSVRNMSQGRGMVGMCREVQGDGVTPNWKWWAGSAGNSLLVERCVFVGHYGRSPVWFFPSISANYMGPGSGAGQIATVTIRDNVGMVASTPTTQAPFDQSKWIMNDPTGGADWTTRGNDVLPYSKLEALFSDQDRLLRRYRTLHGSTAASSLAVKTFTYPHGYAAETSTRRGRG